MKRAKTTFMSYPYIVLILFVHTFLSAVILSSTSVSADDSVVDIVNVTVPASCTLSGTGMNSHTAEISNGTYQANIGTTTLKAFCNDNNGFAIYAAGYTGNEIGATNSNKLVGTSASGNATIVTGLATSTPNPDVSNWAMKLTATGDSGDTTGTNALTIDSDTEGIFSNYHTVPNEYTKVAHKNTSTDMNQSTGGATLTTTYAAYISKTQPADTYTGRVIYTLVHPANHATPVYLNPNADDISEVDYMQQFAVVSDENRQAIIDSMVPEQQYTVLDSRDGKSYTIAKLPVSSDDDDIFEIIYNYLDTCYTSGDYDEDDCDPEIYSQLPNDWKAYTSSYDPSTDEFDESLRPLIYDVWMTKNLDLDLDSSKTYTNEDTDIGYNTSTGTYDVASWSPSRSTYTTTATQTTVWCGGGSLQNSSDCGQNETPESYDPGDLYWNGTEGDYWNDWRYYSDSCDETVNPPSCDQSLNPISSFVSSTGIIQYHLGNYYNWVAAVAANDGSVYTGEIVEQSICPAGWTLPRGGNGDDSFYPLWDYYGFSRNSVNGTDKLWTSPLYFILAGGVSYGYLNEVGLSGSFWTAKSNDGHDAFGSGAGTQSAYPNSGWSRFVGASVRCVVRPVASLVSGGGGGEV